MSSALSDSGSTSRWRKIRQRIIMRDGGVCQMCGMEGDSVDHIVPRHAGGSDEDYNLQLLCTSCNSSKGGRFFGTGNTPPTLHDLNIPNNVSVSHD